MMKKILLSLSLLMAWCVGFAQILTSSPAFPTQNDNITIYYNTTSGNGALLGAIPVYAHTGIITNNSTSNSDWQHVVGNWGTADPAVVMQYVSPNVFKIVITPQTFYSLNVGETATRLMFVFRNQSGSIVGRNADGSDIYLDLYQAGFNAGFTAPTANPVITNPSTNVAVTCTASTASTISLNVNGSEVATQSAATTLSYTFNNATPGEYELVMIANDGTTTQQDTTHIIVMPSIPVVEPPAGTQDGITSVNGNTIRLQLYAPNKDYVFVIGDFNNWQPSLQYLMNRNAAGDTYWLDITGLDPNVEYRFQYRIDAEDMRIADPYSAKILDPWNDQYIPTSTYPNLISYPNQLTTQPVTAYKINPTPYTWTDQSFSRPPKERLVVYELLVRDFIGAQNYQTLKDTLDYIQNLGITAIELMPINEFEGNLSWGYNPAFFFAPDKYYGTPEDLKAFVNECHLRGIAVVQDIALNHAFGTNPMVRMYFNPDAGQYGQPTAENPWFNQTSPHPYGVGYDFNHESARTRAFCKRVIAYWMSEYHIDGYRFDLSKGFTNTNSGSNVGTWGQYDQSRVNIWNDYYSAMQAANPGCYAILEHFADNSEEIALSNAGMMLWGNIAYNSEQATMGYTDNNLSNASYQARGWSNANLVGYGESHDEERLSYKMIHYGNSSGSYSVQNVTTAAARMEAFHSIFFSIPGPKMMYEFGELAYDYGIEYCSNGTYSTDGSCRLDIKPCRWDYLNVASRQHSYYVCAAVNKLKKTQPVFSTTDYSIDLGGLGKRVMLNHTSMKAVVNSNFNVTAIDMVPGFQHTGTWYDYFSHTSFQVTDINATRHYEPGEYHIFTDVQLDAPEMGTSVAELNNLLNRDVIVYPNPSAAVFNIDILTTSAGQVSVEVLDMMGRTVGKLETAYYGAGNHQLTWDAEKAGLSAGNYLLRVVTANGVYNEQISLSGR